MQDGCLIFVGVYLRSRGRVSTENIEEEGRGERGEVVTKKLSGQEGEAPLFYDFFILHVLYYFLT